MREAMTFGNAQVLHSFHLLIYFFPPCSGRRLQGCDIFSPVLLSLLPRLPVNIDLASWLNPEQSLFQERDGDFKGFSAVSLGIRYTVPRGNVIVMIVGSSELSMLGQCLGISLLQIPKQRAYKSSGIISSLQKKWRLQNLSC